MLGMVWFRGDLRIKDNQALYSATQQCKEGVIALYIIDHEFIIKHAVAHSKVDFILRGLTLLSADLAKLNIPLITIEVIASKENPAMILKLMLKHQSQALFFNRQYEIDEKRRDEAVEKLLLQHNIEIHGYDDSVILPPSSVLNQQGDFFKIFTPYKKAWYQIFLINPPKLLPDIKAQPILLVQKVGPPENHKAYQSKIKPDLWPAGEKIAHRKLQNFINENLFSYDQRRDFPYLAATSQLSPYLATGMISARECFLEAYKANHHQFQKGNQGAIIWMVELIWREFYKHLLAALPRLSKGQAYQLETDKFPWRYDKKLFQCWAQGKTGIPIIDAAMRQLNTTGWMHNRLRMITASFLAKNLQLDWRMGEKYFMENLIDGDFSANNGGWQWSASTGVDAAPYFRVFNPIIQSKRFDAQGLFIRHYCPELKELTDKEIHNPTLSCPEKLALINYPKAIVDLKISRRNFIAAWRKI